MHKLRCAESCKNLYIKGKIIKFFESDVSTHFEIFLSNKIRANWFVRVHVCLKFIVDIIIDLFNCWLYSSYSCKELWKQSYTPVINLYLEKRFISTIDRIVIIIRNYSENNFPSMDYTYPYKNRKIYKYTELK